MDENQLGRYYQEVNEREYEDRRLELLQRKVRPLPANVRWDDELGWDYITATCGH